MGALQNTRAAGTASGVATRYGLTVQGPDPGGGPDFPYPFRPTMGPTQPPV